MLMLRCYVHVRVQLKLQPSASLKPQQMRRAHQVLKARRAVVAAYQDRFMTFAQLRLLLYPLPAVVVRCLEPAPTRRHHVSCVLLDMRQHYLRGTFVEVPLL